MRIRTWTMTACGGHYDSVPTSLFACVSGWNKQHCSRTSERDWISHFINVQTSACAVLRKWKTKNQQGWNQGKTSFLCADADASMRMQPWQHAHETMIVCLHHYSCANSLTSVPAAFTSFFWIARCLQKGRQRKPFSAKNFPTRSLCKRRKFYKQSRLQHHDFFWIFGRTARKSAFFLHHKSKHGKLASSCKNPKFTACV